MHRSPLAFLGTCSLLLVMLSACSTSCDPRKGGLIGGLKGISGCYEERVGEKGSELESETELKAQSQQTATELKTKREEQASRRLELQQKADILERRLANLRGDLAQAKSELGPGNAELLELESEVRCLEQRRNAILGASQPDAKCLDGVDATQDTVKGANLDQSEKELNRIESRIRELEEALAEAIQKL